MQTTKVIGVDIDNVVVNTGRTWFDWSVEHFGISDEGLALYNDDVRGQRLDFTHSRYFPHVPLNENLEYWHRADLYDNLDIEPEALRVLNALERQGHEILFVSHVIGHHGHSKENMLKRAFSKPQHMWTEHKHFARVDALIDDRFKNFQKFPQTSPNTALIHFETAYHDEFKEKIVLTPDAIQRHLYSKDWDQIMDYILSASKR